MFGASDDLVEFRGAIDDELGACEGTEALISKDGKFLPHDIEDHEEWLEEHGLLADFKARFPNKVVATRSGVDGPSWRITTDIPHATFMIMEDGEEYCQGIVFNLSDLK